MTKRKLPPLNPGPDPVLEAAAAELITQLGAAELHPDLVPPHWLTGPSFGIWVEGTKGARPAWSPREAGKIAKAMLTTLEFRRMQNRAAEAMGKGRVNTIPKFVKVQVCPTCNELQGGSSQASRSQDECGICPTNCPRRGSHKSNQYNCDECRVEMQVLWTSKDPIPEDWLI
jgi:hypothetical protein